MAVPAPDRQRMPLSTLMSPNKSDIITRPGRAARNEPLTRTTAFVLIFIIWFTSLVHAALRCACSRGLSASAPVRSLGSPFVMRPFRTPSRGICTKDQFFQFFLSQRRSFFPVFFSYLNISLADRSRYCLPRLLSLSL